MCAFLAGILRNSPRSAPSWGLVVALTADLQEIQEDRKAVRRKYTDYPSSNSSLPEAKFCLQYHSPKELEADGRWTARNACAAALVAPAHAAGLAHRTRGRGSGYGTTPRSWSSQGRRPPMRTRTSSFAGSSMCAGGSRRSRARRGAGVGLVTSDGLLLRPSRVNEFPLAAIGKDRKESKRGKEVSEVLQRWIGTLESGGASRELHGHLLAIPHLTLRQP